MLVNSSSQVLLDFVHPFRPGSGRFPQQSDLRTINTLIENLAVENPTPVLRTAFQQVAGLWQCVFTSRFVLDLGRIPGLKLSGVYQSVIIDPNLNTGHYFNIAELVRGEKVKGVCGEFASICPSQFDPVRIDVQYHWFYFAFRIMARYEGYQTVAVELQRNRLARQVRLPFHRSGWQSIIYLDDRLRVLRGNHGGVFVLAKQSSTSRELRQKR
jgi:PAP fibrillin